MMLYGTVTYVMKHDPEGKDVKIDWAARAEFEDGLEGPRMRYYQVYLVCFALPPPFLTWLRVCCLGLILEE